MKVLRKRDVPEEKYSNAFLGFGPETSNFVVELTYSICLLSLLVYTKVILLDSYEKSGLQTMVLAHMTLELDLGISLFQLKM